MKNVVGKKIVLTGGGTTGHVSVNLALIPKLLERGWDVYYMGSENGIERTLIADYPEVKYEAISVGKLRRFLSMENLKDAFRVARGVLQAKRKIKRIQPDVIFSKGGFVAVPVVYGGAMNKVPAITHESDLTPGLANKLCFKKVVEVMVTFEKTAQYVPENKAFYLGPVIRDELKNGDRERALEKYGFDGSKPILLVMGGSLGSLAVNQCIWKNLDALLEKFDILHGTGKDKIDNSLSRPGYVQIEYIKDGLNDVLAMSDIIISRAGSNAIFEFLYYQKPMLLIPLPLSQSRGDQILNAETFQEVGYANMIDEDTMTDETFLQAVIDTWDGREEMKEKQDGFAFRDTVEIIYQELVKLV